MSLTFSKFFENYTNYHSFVDLVNLCREVCDFVVMNDITDSPFFSTFEEVDNGYEIIFNKSEMNNYFINIKNETIKDEHGEKQLIDRVYEDIETLYSMIKNDNILINIKQIDEKVKTFNEYIKKK